MALIHEQLKKVREEIGFVGKGHANTQQNYSFRSVEDALSMCGPVLMRHGVQAIPRVTQRTTTPLDHVAKDGKPRVDYHTTLTMELDFIAEDGSTITVVTIGEGIDTGDKSSAKAMSAAYKYGIFLGLAVPITGNALDDPDRRNKRRNGEHPKESASPFTLALAAINNAHANADLLRYKKSIESRADEFTAEQTKTLEEAIAARTVALCGGREKQPA